MKTSSDTVESNRQDAAAPATSSSGVDPLRAALRKQIETDRLLGVRSVPIPADVSARVAHCGGLSVDASEKADRLRGLDENHVRGCTKCRLCETRTQTVFGQGNPSARIVFVGEAPGYEEDRQGLAFVGPAGQLLTRMIAAMGLSRDDVFICNVLKCRPPNNRDPSADEILACSPYLREQLAVIEPEVLVALGAPAAKTLLNTTASIGKLRGRFHEYVLTDAPSGSATIPVMPTYHPAYLLRSPGDKPKAWDDLQMVLHLLGLPVPDWRDGRSA